MVDGKWEFLPSDSLYCSSNGPTTTTTSTSTKTDPPAARVRRESDLDDFKYILPETLDPNNFVICEDECKDEGYWALIGKDVLNYLIIKNFQPSELVEVWL